MPTADEIFRGDLERRGLTFTLNSEGLYLICVNETDFTISLENIRRDYQRDGDPGAVVRFVDRITGIVTTEPPSWRDVGPYIRYSLEPWDHDGEFADVVIEQVNDELSKIFVYVPEDGSSITWIDESAMESWGVGREEIIKLAGANMSKIVARTTLECTEIDGVKLGILNTDETPFKASLVLSPAFRELVSPVVGWPVYVVVPCRDFVYVLGAKDRDFLGRLGYVVIEQYRQSGYPITKDVLEVSDRGVTAIGTLPEPE